DLSTGLHLRLGVTGLSRSGKTIFITALIDHLTKAAGPALRGRKNMLPVFRVHSEGRLTGGTLEPQPDDAVPRFAYEDHIATLAAQWRLLANDTNPRAEASEERARREAEAFTAYLRDCRKGDYHFSTLPPGRFLMPGDLEGSPALTFAPLAVEQGEIYRPDS